MDNFFEILIYLIIIVSFLSSLFKKKEPERKPQTKPKESGRTIPDSDNLAQSKQSESFDILKEIENIFKQEMGLPEPTKEEIPVEKVKTEIEDKYQEALQKNYDRDLTDELSAEARAKKSREITRIIDEKTKRDAEKFEELLHFQSRFKMKKHPIVEKLKNPQSLKEYILISEILGKPVAYKR